MRKWTMMVALGVIAMGGFAQGTNGAVAEQNLEEIGDGIAFRSFDNRYEGTKGSPMLFEQFQKANIELGDGKTFENVYVNIDFFQNKVFVNRTSQVIEPNVPVTKVEFADSKKVFVSGKDLGDKDIFMAELLSAGDVNLYAERGKKFLKASYTGAYSANKPYDEFIDKTSYYVQKKDGKLVSFKAKKKALLEYVPMSKKELSEYLLKENMDLGEEKDLVRFFNYVNYGIFN